MSDGTPPIKAVHGLIRVRRDSVEALETCLFSSEIAFRFVVFVK